MRTTLTLDDDVAAGLRTEARKSGEPFKQVVNRVLHFGLHAQAKAKALPRFRVKARPLGLRPGLSYDDVWGLIEQVEGPGYR